MDNATLTGGTGNDLFVGLGNNVSVECPNTVSKIVLVGQGDYVDVPGGSVTLESGASANVAGGNVAVALNGNGYAGLIGGAGYTVTDSGTGSTIATRVNTGFTVQNTNGDTIYDNVGDQASVSGTNNTISLAGNAALTLQGGSGETVNTVGNGSSITAAANTGFTENNSSGGPVSINIGTGDQASLTGGNAAVSLDGYAAHIELEGGSGYAIDALGSGNAVETFSGTNFTEQNDSGGGNYVSLNTSDQAQLSGSEITAYLAGYGDTVDLEGGSDYSVLAKGSGSTITAFYGTSFKEQNDSDGATYISENSDDQATLIGGNATVYFDGGSTVDLQGGNDYHVFGSGSGSTITAEADTTNVTVDTTGDTVQLNQGDSAHVSGGDNTINGGFDEAITAGDTGGAFDTIQVTNDYNNVNAADGSQTGIYLDANTQANIVGSGDYAQLAAGDSLGVYGGGNAIATAANDDVVVGQTNGNFDSITGSGDLSGYQAANGQATGIYLQNNSQANLAGSSDTVNLGTGDSLGAYGGSNTVTTQSGDLVVVGQTDGAFDLVTGNGDQGGGVTANGQSTGIYLDDNAQANLVGGSDTVTLGVGDSLGSYGGGNTIGAAANDAVVVGNTGGNFDTINANNDQAGGVAANGQAAGIYLNSSTQANIVGNDNTEDLSTGDSLGAYGGGNTINSSAGNTVVAGNTGGDFDTINANDDTGGNTAANGQATGIFLDNNTQANVNGSYDTENLATGDSLGAYGGGNTINSSAGNLVVAGSTGGVFDTINASYDMACYTTANGQPTGIALDVNSQANVYGSFDTVTNQGMGSSLGVYGGGGNTINGATGNDVVDVGGNTPSTPDTINASNDQSLGVTDGGVAIVDGSGNATSYFGTGSVTTNGLTDTHVVGSAATPYSSYDDLSGPGVDTQRITNFSDGSHAVEIWDSQGNQPWDKIDLIYDDTGTLQFNKTDFNNGSWTSMAYDNPISSDYNGNEVQHFSAIQTVFSKSGTELGINFYNSDGSLGAQLGGPTNAAGNNFLTQQAAVAGEGKQTLSAFNDDNSGAQGIFGNVESQVGGVYGNANLGVGSNSTSNVSGESQNNAGGSLLDPGGPLSNSEPFSSLDPGYSGSLELSAEPFIVGTPSYSFS